MSTSGLYMCVHTPCIPIEKVNTVDLTEILSLLLLFLISVLMVSSVVQGYF